MSDPATLALVLVLVLVHGSWHGPWAWEQDVPLLAAQGVRTITQALPSMGAVEWHIPHSPMLSQPQLVADLLATLARA